MVAKTFVARMECDAWQPNETFKTWSELKTWIEVLETQRNWSDENVRLDHRQAVDNFINLSAQLLEPPCDG